jgi:hypothetical protein
MKNIKKFKMRSGFTEVEMEDDVLIITHGGNMGNTIEHSVDPNLRTMGIIPIKDLKKMYEVISETGSPDYMYEIIFDMRRKK